MGVKQRILIPPLKPQNEYLELFLDKDNQPDKSSTENAGVGNLHSNVDIQKIETETTENKSVLNLCDDVKRFSSIQCLESDDKFVRRKIRKGTMTRTRKKASEPRIQTYGRGRPRKKSFGKKNGNSNDKQSQDGSENGEGRSNRSRQRGGGGQGNGGNGGRRKKDDDDRDDDNDDLDDDYDENNDDEDDDDDEQTCVESSVEEPEMTPEQEAEMAQELLSLIPPKHLNCDPPEKPAKPGTAVDLHGVVLHETSGGLVVLNVRWRNKIYSGALIDVRKSKWATERIKPDPFPEAVNPRPADLLYLSGGKRKSKKSTEDIEKETKKSTDLQTSETFKEPTGLPLSFKRPQDSNSNDDANVRKKARLSPPLIECPEPNCGKRYSHKNGLKYHQAHAHQKKDDTDEQKVMVQKTAPLSTESTKDVPKLEPEEDQVNMNMTDTKDSQLDVVGSGDASRQATDPTTAVSISMAVDSEKAQALLQTVPQITPQTVPEIMSQTATQVIPKTSAATLPPTSTQVLPQTVPQIVIKTEEESAVDSIKDVNFEVTIKEENTSQDEKDVAKIMLESSEPGHLFPPGSSISLSPFTARSALSFAQFSPTLASLNPQMINNSLSNALQTVVSKDEEKKYPKEEENENNDENGSDVDDQRSKLELNLADSLKDKDIMKQHLLMNKDIRNEDIVPSSPDDFVPSTDILPDSFGIHLYQQKPKQDTFQTSQTWNNEASQTFSPSLFSVSLYNQIRQEQASRLFPGADAVTGDLAEPSDIQRAISQVDVRRHFSPMLLNYLNTGSRGKESNNADPESSGADVVSTSEKSDDYMKSNRTNESKENSNVASSSFSQSSPKPESIKKEKYNEQRATPGNLPTKPEFLQPNISAGRPISRPVTKPERITGGVKIQGNMQRYSNNQSSSSISAGDGRNEEMSQNSLMFAASTDNAANQSTGKQGSQTSIAGDVSSSYLDKTMVEAKTWIPQEVYRQPSKSISGQERSPVKEKHGASVRMSLEQAKKTFASNISGNDDAKQFEQSLSNKKNKQDSHQQYHSFVNQISDQDKEKDKSSSEKEVSPDVSEASRFTMTSEGLVPSPADSRGRPRKVRVEKTQQIPVGSAKEVELSRATSEQNPRKQPMTTYTRSSVIHSMSTPPEEMRSGVTVKEEYVSPDGKRKGSPRAPERSSLEKKMKPDFKKMEVNRLFEAERERLKNRHIESHYANEVRNLQLRGGELPSVAKTELALRRSASPGISRMHNLPPGSAEKQDRHVREKLEAKGIPMSPAFGQSSPFHSHSHSSSDLEKLRSEYMQHDLSRIPVPFGGSLLPSGEGYPGLPTSFPTSSYYGHRSVPSQRFEQLMSSHMDQEKAYSKYSAEKSDLGMKHAHESSKIPPQDRMRSSSRDGHSQRPSYYPQASPLGYQSRETSSNPTRSPKSSPFGFRPSEMFAASRSQRIESEAALKDSKAVSVSDSRRDIRRDYGIPYSSFFQPSFQYPNISSSVPGKSYSQRMSEQRSPYKPPDADRSRYPPHPGNQPQTGPSGMLSANLVVTKADSLGFGSLPYDSRNPEGKK